TRGPRRGGCLTASSSGSPACARWFVTVEAPPRRTVLAAAPASAAFAPIQRLRAHEYVAEQIRRHIALRLICPGESLPSERELAAIFGVGRETIQHALRLLAQDGLLVARRGRRGGTFVSAPPEDTAAMEELMTRL